MKGSFDDADNQVSRLMEVLGGSADAYEAPQPAPREQQAPDTKKPNPFGDPNEGSEDSNSDPLAGIIGDEPTPAEEAQVSEDESWDCGYMLDSDRPSRPAPLDGTYSYHAIVEDCGELKSIWDAFVEVIVDQQPKQVTLDSGTYEIIQTPPQGLWALVDTFKDRKYLLEAGNLTGHLKPGEKFIWVKSLTEVGRDFGYIHQGYVFLHK